MAKNKLLSELGSVNIGFSFRGAIPAHADGDLLVVQARNILPDSEIDKAATFTRTTSSLVGNKAQRLRKGDVLLTTRSIGPGGFRASVCGEIGENAVASSSICVIRLEDAAVLPQYLMLYLNSVPGQAALGRNSSGSMVHALLLRHIRELEVPIPNMTGQRNLVGLLQNTKAHKRLLERKKELLQAIGRYTTSQVIESNTL